MTTHFQVLKGTAARRGFSGRAKKLTGRKDRLWWAVGLAGAGAPEGNPSCMLGLENDISLAENFYSYIRVYQGL
jgi:hypothetical protein